MSDLILKHKYFSQRNNADDLATKNNEAYTTCNVTSLVIGLSCLKINKQPMELFQQANSDKFISIAKKIGAWTDEYIKGKKLNQVWVVLEKLADEIIGKESGGTFGSEWLTLNDITDYLDKGCPVLVGGSFTHGGHIVCIVGYNDRGFIVADPWGNWESDYKNIDGDNCLYHYEKIRTVLSGNQKKGMYLGLVLSL